MRCIKKSSGFLFFLLCLSWFFCVSQGSLDLCKVSSQSSFIRFLRFSQGSFGFLKICHGGSFGFLIVFLDSIVYVFWGSFGSFSWIPYVSFCFFGVHWGFFEVFLFLKGSFWLTICLMTHSLAQCMNQQTKDTILEQSDLRLQHVSEIPLKTA